MSEISQKRLEANRQNAKLGGVKTNEGKSISKYNALKHGLLSSEVLLDSDDENAIIEISKHIRAELKPSGEIEIILTDRIVANIWRLKRLLKVEKTTMEWQSQEELTSAIHFNNNKEQIDRKAVRDMIANEDIEKLLRYETSIERGIFKALHELQRIQASRLGERPLLPIAVDIDVAKE